MLKYKVEHTKPKFWWVFKIFFPNIDWERNVLTFGNTIYAKEPLRPDVEQHELVHIRQQKGSKIYGAWMILWYCLLPKFRYKLEVEACTVQMDWVKDKIPDDIYRALYEEQVAHLKFVIGQGKIPRSQILIDFPLNKELKVPTMEEINKLLQR